LTDAQARLAEFSAANAQVVGVNTDTVPSHIAYQKELGGLAFPLATDRWPYAETASKYGIFPPTKHPVPFFNDRAVFVVDQNGQIAWSKIYELRTVPDFGEVLAEVKKLG
jgi:alkyl hydroperoxide reductase subunit AhpC